MGRVGRREPADPPLPLYLGTGGGIVQESRQVSWQAHPHNLNIKTAIHMLTL